MTMSTDTADIDFGLQVAIWGYAITGRLLETAALVAEGHADLVPGGAWDRTAADLAGQMVSHGDEPYRKVRDWAAMPWMAEHILRNHEKWPGL